MAMKNLNAASLTKNSVIAYWRGPNRSVHEKTLRCFNGTVGCSLLHGGNLEKCITTIRAKSQAPVILFPGNEMQVTRKADALLLLSVISGRNPDLLIGRHVAAAAMVKASG